MRANEFVTERKKYKRKSRGAAYGPGPYGGYGYYAGYSGDSGEGGDGGGESIKNEDAMMGKIADSGKIIRILKKAHTVPFSDEKNWLLVDMDPAKGNKGLGIKWIPADTRFEWVRPYKDTAEPSVVEGKLTKSAIFLNPNTVIVGQQHGQPLELPPKTLKKVQAIAAKHGAWYEGNGADRSYTKGQIDRYVGSWDDKVAKTASPNDPKWIYVLFANVDENNRVQRVGIDPNDTIFNRLLDTAKDNSFQGIGYTSQALQKFLQKASEGKYDFLKMSQQPATQKNLTRFLKAGEALMWPSNWEQYPNKAGKIAKAATVDVRDQYLATRKTGVYVTGSGHLKAVQNITGKQGVAENFADGKNPQDKGDSKRHGINTKGSVSSLRKTAKQGGRKGQLAHWLANMKSGRSKKK